MDSASVCFPVSQYGVHTIRSSSHVNLHILTRLGTFRNALYITNIERDVTVFLLSIASFFPNASMSIPSWPAEEPLHMIIVWFESVWKRQTRRQNVGRKS